MKAMKVKKSSAPAMKTMKTMKAMKAAMKGMKAMKAMKVKKSKIARGKMARSVVFRGFKEKTVGGLTKDQLTRNKGGKVVSKARSAHAKKRYASGLKKWIDAVQLARKQLGITGFCSVNGKTAQGKALYAKAKSIVGK